MRAANWLGSIVVTAALGYGCESRGLPRGHTNSYLAASGSGGSGSSTSLGAGGSCDEQSECGTETHAIAFNAPNIYFVLDGSGSMALFAKPGKTRYQLVRDASISLIQSLGPLINVGTALFPGKTTACTSGSEVMAVMPGDPYNAKVEGPTLAAFKKATNRNPYGGTPTSGTLAAIAPMLAALTGRTVVLLATDGGPNCNPKASCQPDDCMAVIEKQCKPSDGCCDPGFPMGGPTLCVDRPATVAAIKAIRALGIDVYVIGIADQQLYRGVLDEMAVAGGVANTSGPTKYTAVDDLDTLASVFGSIAAQAISCTIKLAEPPAGPDLTNVYFDCDVVPSDAAHGWTWTDTATVTLHGNACIKLKSGKVSQVKVLTGCPTEKPK